MTGESSPISIYETLQGLDQRSAVDNMKLNPEKIDYRHWPGLWIQFFPLSSSVFVEKHHDASPAKFRKSRPTGVPAGSFTWRSAFTAHFKTAQEYDSRIEIQELFDFFVLYERFIGGMGTGKALVLDFRICIASILQEGSHLSGTFFQ